MRAALLEQPGTPVFGSFEEPVAGDGHAVVDVAVAGVNPVDLTIAAGRFVVMPPFPSAAGREGVGTIDGRRVYFNAPVMPFGSMAERSLVDPDRVFDVPDALDDGVAVALGIAGMAAWLPLEWRARLQPGETVLVLGATGVLGSIAVQAARLLGAGRIVAAGRDPEGLRRALRLGADAAVNLAEGDVPALTSAIREAAGGGVDVTIDPLWGTPALAALGAANVHARHVQLGSSAGAEAAVPAGFRQTATSILGYTTLHVPLDDQRDAYKRMGRHAAAGELEVEVERIPLRDVATAWERQAASPHHKLVLVP